MKKLRGLLAFTSCIPVVVVMGGCVEATFVPTGAVYPARVSDCEIEVFSATLPDREYEEIGLVEGEGSHWKSGLRDVLPRLQEQACLAGGNGIILLSEDKFAQGETGYPVLRTSATVVRWR